MGLTELCSFIDNFHPRFLVLLLGLNLTNVFANLASARAGCIIRLLRILPRGDS